MGKLTRRDEFGNADIIGVDSMELQCSLGFDEFNKVTDALNKLAEYEELEEQGKLQKLPCKLGVTAFWISDEDGDGNKIPTIRESNPIIGIAIHEDGLYILTDKDDEYQKVGTRWAFLTREEAEAALEGEEVS